MTETETYDGHLHWRMTGTKAYYEQRTVRLIEQRLIMDNTVDARLNASLTMNSRIDPRQNTMAIVIDALFKWDQSNVPTDRCVKVFSPISLRTDLSTDRLL